MELTEHYQYRLILDWLFSSGLHFEAKLLKSLDLYLDQSFVISLPESIDECLIAQPHKSLCSGYKICIITTLLEFE